MTYQVSPSSLDHAVLVEHLAVVEAQRAPVAAELLRPVGHLAHGRELPVAEQVVEIALGVLQGLQLLACLLGRGLRGRSGNGGHQCRDGERRGEDACGPKRSSLIHGRPSFPYSARSTSTTFAAVARRSGHRHATSAASARTGSGAP